MLDKHIGAARFIFNLALETKNMAWAGNRVSLSCFDLINQLPDLKKECEWLKEIASQTLQEPIINLDRAFTRFFKGQSDFPSFKKKSSGGNFCARQYVTIRNGKLCVPKFMDGIAISLHRVPEGQIKKAHISRSATGKYFASLLCETGAAVPEKKSVKDKTTTGIDLGLKTFLVTSEGEEFANPRFLRKSLSKLKFTQRKYSKSKGERARKKLALIHEKVANQRKDFLHKTSSHIVKNHDTICIEDLNIAGMKRNHCLALSVSDAGWSEFVRQLEYKAEWGGKNILKIGQFDPSSKTCSCCGKINKELTLKDREWTCAGCGSILNRDFNAAVNIKNFALKNHLSKGIRLKNQKKLPTLVGVLISEAPLRVCRNKPLK